MQRARNTDRGTAARRHISLPLAVSLAVHAALILALLLWYAPWRGVDSRPNGIASANSQGEANHVGSSSHSPPAPVPPVAPAHVPPQQIDQAVSAAIEGAAKASDERKLEELESQIKKLDRIGSQDSLQEIADAVVEASGLSKRAAVPVSLPSKGSFDFDTAQFHSVTRTEGSDGAWQYRSVMIDAQGQSMEVDLDPQEGKTAYEAMQIVNQSPLAESIYRTIVMPMLDKMVPRGSALSSPSPGSAPNSQR